VSLRPTSLEIINKIKWEIRGRMDTILTRNFKTIDRCWIEDLKKSTWFDHIGISTIPRGWVISYMVHWFIGFNSYVFGFIGNEIVFLKHFWQPTGITGCLVEYLFCSFFLLKGLKRCLRNILCCFAGGGLEKLAYRSLDLKLSIMLILHWHCNWYAAFLSSFSQLKGWGGG